MASTTAGPSNAPAPTSRIIRGTRRKLAAMSHTSPAASITANVWITSSGVTAGILAADPAVFLLHGRRALPHDAGVLVFLLLGWAPLPLLLALLLALYLTVVELRELRPHYLWWAWWLLLVFMTHFVGYLILRGYGVYHRRQQRAAT
jgi:hypothetical protein